jgi:hypothetical protein
MISLGCFLCRASTLSERFFWLFCPTEFINKHDLFRIR